MNLIKYPAVKLREINYISYNKTQNLQEIIEFGKLQILSKSCEENNIKSIVRLSLHFLKGHPLK